jgi:hypothetical protein
MPRIAMVLFDQAAETPAGKSVAVPMPVALVVTCLIFVKAVTVSVDLAAAAQ